MGNVLMRDISSEYGKSVKSTLKDIIVKLQSVYGSSIKSVVLFDNCITVVLENGSLYEIPMKEESALYSIWTAEKLNVLRNLYKDIANKVELINKGFTVKVVKVEYFSEGINYNYYEYSDGGRSWCFEGV